MFYRGGLGFVSPVLMANTTFQAQLVFQNLTSVLSGGSGICSECSTEIVLLIHTSLINDVGDRSALVTASSYYGSGSTVSTVRVETQSVIYTVLIGMHLYLGVFIVLTADGCMVFSSQ